MDLVVLATGMTPRKNDTLNNVLKIPESKDGLSKRFIFKLRPVETAIDGVFIAGARKAPRTWPKALPRPWQR